MQLTPEQQQIGVITSSAGNHAQGLSYHGKLLNIPVTIVMPKSSPLMKIEMCKKLGGTVIIEGANLGEAKRIALQIGHQTGLIFING